MPYNSDTAEARLSQERSDRPNSYMRRHYESRMSAHFQRLCGRLGMENAQDCGPLAFAYVSREGILRSILGTPGAGILPFGLQEGMKLQMPLSRDDCVIYSEKLLFQEQWKDFPVVEMGWILCLCCRETAADLYRGILKVMAHDLILNIHCGSIVGSLYGSSSNRGMLFVDMHVPGETTIVDANDQFFRMTQNEDRQDRIHLSNLIDPLPANQTFWEIVNRRRIVEDLQIRLTIHNKTDQYYLTSRPYEQAIVGGAGIILYLDHPSQIASNLSKKISNTAIFRFHDIIGSSAALQNAISIARQIAAVDSNVLLMGESGVGKDVFAQAIHNASTRADKPYIVVNCGAIPHELIASELFGYEAGAFTGASRTGNIGKFELANGGTIFLDEIGELPLEMQAALLRVAENKQFMRVGGRSYINVDVKIICATNADLIHMIEEKTFRLDLYYRLSTMQVEIPPLRERGNDVLELADYFIDRAAQKSGRRIRLSAEARNFLVTLPYRGNVRELQNIIERLVMLGDNEEVYIADIYRCNQYLRRQIRQNPPLEQILQETGRDDGVNVTDSDLRKNDTDPAYGHRAGRRRLTKEKVMEALEQNDYHRELTAEALGISRTTLYRRMLEFGLLQGE